MQNYKSIKRLFDAYLFLQSLKTSLSDMCLCATLSQKQFNISKVCTVTVVNCNYVF
jgi:hypothetical protein